MNTKVPCPDCEKLLAELEALKAELVAACVMSSSDPILDRVDQVIAGFEHTQQALVALVDRHMHDSLARLDRLEAAMRFPRGEPPSEPPARVN
jgi:hypothetical protein